MENNYNTLEQANRAQNRPLFVADTGGYLCNFRCNSLAFAEAAVWTPY
jgi:hypothetical protein